MEPLPVNFPVSVKARHRFATLYFSLPAIMIIYRVRSRADLYRKFEASVLKDRAYSYGGTE